MTTLRKIFIILITTFAMSAHAQEHFTLWYGINYAGETNQTYSSDDKRFRFLNVGVDYTNSIADKWDWSVGASVNSKGACYKATYVQAEGNASYCLLGENKTKLSVFSGPYVGVKVSGNESSFDYGDSDRGSKNKYNAFSCGWQAGLGVTCSYLSFKVGYEHAFTNIASDMLYSHKTYQWFARIGLNLELLKKR